MGSWLFLLIGLAAGVLSGMFGLGGGVVIVPALIYLARLPTQTATGTSLAALLLPVGALGAYEYYRHGQLDLVAAGLIALGLFIGAGFGARLALMMSGMMLRRAFAMLLLLMAIRLWFSRPEAAARAPATDAAPGAPAH